MGFNQTQEKGYLSRYKSCEYSYNKSQTFLLSIDKIPFAKELDNEVNKKIKDIKLYYNILNEIQEQENKKTYLITFTSPFILKEKAEKFIKAMNNLKNIKKFIGLEFDYFSIIEPKNSGVKHLHIKIVIDNIRGVYSAINRILKKLDYRYVSIKKQTKDNFNYLLKTLKKDNYKIFVGWLDYHYLSLNQVVKRSRYIKIDENVKITLKKYKNILKILLKNKPIKYVGLKEVKAYILSKQTKKYNLYLILNNIINTKKLTIRTIQSKQTLYNNIYQVGLYFNLIIFTIELKNNSPNLGKTTNHLFNFLFLIY